MLTVCLKKKASWGSLLNLPGRFTQTNSGAKNVEGGKAVRMLMVVSRILNCTFKGRRGKKKKSQGVKVSGEGGGDYERVFIKNPKRKRLNKRREKGKKVLFAQG